MRELQSLEKRIAVPAEDPQSPIAAAIVFISQRPRQALNWPLITTLLSSRIRSGARGAAIRSAF